MTTEEFDNQTGRFRVREVSGYDFGWVIIDTRDGTEVGSDVCEPEDALLVRDFAWVREALNAVDAERDAALADLRDARALAFRALTRITPLSGSQRIMVLGWEKYESAFAFGADGSGK